VTPQVPPPHADVLPTDAIGNVTMVNPTQSRAFSDHFKSSFDAAAPQIEGAAFEDGKGPWVWDTFARQPDSLYEGDTLDVACDYCHRYDDRVDHWVTLVRAGVCNDHATQQRTPKARVHWHSAVIRHHCIQ